MLKLNLSEGAPIGIADELAGGGCDLGGLRTLVGGTLSQEELAVDVVMRPSETPHDHYCFAKDGGSYSYFVQTPVAKPVLIWRQALLFAFAARILRGEKLLPVHGCLLKDGRGNGLLLCAQSGMGKTTTAKRWRAAGGQAAADDMVLLEGGAETLWAHPLPTWSRCFESTAGEDVSFEDAVPVKRIVALSRDEKAEAVREVEGFKYMSAIYSACMLFNSPLIKSAAPERRERLAAALKVGAQALYDRFPHRMFFANLQGDVKRTLEGEFT